jgi:5'-3' exonuclease
VNLHFIDGTFELFRAFYGKAPKAMSLGGQEISATRAFMRSINRLLKDPDVTHVACAFDHEIESFRNDLFDGYKTGEGIDPELFAQFGLVEEGCRALGVVVWPMLEFEADDALAAGAALYRNDPRVDTIYLCTPDKDLAQCVLGTKVVMWDRMRENILDEEGVGTKFGIRPESIPDYLALVGDTADGIPGIPRWGAKSTAAVLQHYVHLEKIPDDVADWAIQVRGAKTLAANLSEAREDAELYRTLATLRTDVKLEESIDDLEWKGYDEERLKAMEAELRFTITR